MPRPKRWMTILLAGASSIFGSGAEAGNGIDLINAYRRVLDASPELQILDLEVEVRRAEHWQASLWPNPLFIAEVDGAGGNCSDGAWDGACVTYTLTQPFEMNCKREKEQKIAAFLAVAAEWAKESAVQDILAELSLLLSNAYAMQERQKIIDQIASLMETSHDCLTHKLTCGKATAIQQMRSSIEVSNHRMEFLSARKELSRARKNLAAKWKGEDDFEEVVFPFNSFSPPPPYEIMAKFIEDNPDLRKSQSEHCAAYAAWEHERAKIIPDIELTAGYAHCRDCEDNGFIFNIAVPLPFFNRNEGNICRAALVETQKRLQQEGQKSALLSKLRIIHEEWLLAFQQAKMLEGTTIPAAEKAYKLVEEGHSEGKFELQDVADAKKAWLQSRLLLISSLLELHQKKIEAYRLIGKMKGWHHVE